MIHIESHSYVCGMPISTNHYDVTILTSELRRCLETNDVIHINCVCRQHYCLNNRLMLLLDDKSASASERAVTLRALQSLLAGMYLQ